MFNFARRAGGTKRARSNKQTYNNMKTNLLNVLSAAVETANTNRQLFVNTAAKAKAEKEAAKEKAKEAAKEKKVEEAKEQAKKAKEAAEAEKRAQKAGKEATDILNVYAAAEAAVKQAKELKEAAQAVQKAINVAKAAEDAGRAGDIVEAYENAKKAEAEAKAEDTRQRDAEREAKAEAELQKQAEEKGAEKQAKKDRKEAIKGLATDAVQEGKSLNAICRNIIEAAKAGSKEKQAALLNFVGIQYPNAKAANITAEHLEQIKASGVISAFKSNTAYISKEDEKAGIRGGQAVKMEKTEAKGVYKAVILSSYSVNEVFFKPANRQADGKTQTSVEVGKYYFIEKKEAKKIGSQRALQMIKEAKEAAAKAAAAKAEAEKQAETDRAAGEALRLAKKAEAEAAE